MNENRNSRLMAEPGDFYMAPSDKNSHSLTPEEIKADLERKTSLAQQGEQALRAELLKQAQTAPSNSTSSEGIERPRYFRINSGMIIKIVPENLLCYKLDLQKKVWIESPSLFVEFEQGNVHGEYIDFDDTFSIAETSDLSKGRSL